MSTSPGAFEGKYEVIGKIREGGMGAIYMVRHRLLDEIRIIKVMRPEVAESADQRKRFLREAQTATRLKHSNIVGFYDFFIDDEGTAFMVMEYIDGINLRDMIRNCGPLPIPLALYLSKQCLSALDYLHRKGIVHRDISPDNIMMHQEEDGTLQAKLIDLGIAKLARAEEQEQLTGADEFIGKLRYSSPEQLTKKASSSAIDGRSDLFSFAVVLYEGTTGVCPFAGGSLQDILSARINKPPIPFAQTDPSSRVPAVLRGVILKSLQKNPDERWQTAQEFSRAIDAVPPAEAAAANPEEVSNYVRAAIEVARRAAAAQNPAGASLQKTLQSKFRVSEVSIRPLEATDLHIQKTLAKWTADATPSGTKAPFPDASESTVASGPKPFPATVPAGSLALPARARSPMVGYALAAVGAVVLVVVGVLLASLLRDRDRRRPDGVEAASGVVKLPVPTAVSVFPTAPAVVVPSMPTAAPDVAPTPAPRSADIVAIPRTEGTSTVLPPAEKKPSVREATPRSSVRIARAETVPVVPNPNRPKIHFCADIGRTQFAQGATQEVPSGFAGSALKPARPDSGRISIQIRMNPEEAVENQDFTVSARFVNGGDETFQMLRAEESSPGVRGGFEAIGALPMPQVVDIGSSIEIYRTTKSLASGSTYRKAFRVVEKRRGDSWENSITVKPCIEQ